MKHPHRNRVRLAERRASAAERAAARAQLTPQQQLDKLDARLGKGVGAVRERARLMKMLNDSQKPVTEATAKETATPKRRRGRGRKAASANKSQA